MGIVSTKTKMSRCWFLVVVLLPFLATQVMAGANPLKAHQLKRAHKVCSNVKNLLFMGESVDVEYEVQEGEDEMTPIDCPPLVVDQGVPIKNRELAHKANSLSKIYEWVCANVKASVHRRDKSHISDEFYITLTESIQEAYQYLIREAQLPELAARDALEIVASSTRSSKLPSLLTNIVTRLPCFCGLVKLMPEEDEHTTQANRAMCRSLLAVHDTPFDYDTYGAGSVTDAFWKSALLNFPAISLKKKGTCTSESFTAMWSSEDKDSWLVCAATFMVNEYEVLLVPRGLRLYHVSEPGARTEPDEMTWFGDKSSADEYTDATGEGEEVRWDQAARRSVHTFSTKQHVFVVRLEGENNEAMLKDLPWGYEMTPQTVLAHDRKVFGALCAKWRQLGIAGYAKADDDTLHPEMMLCTPRESVMSSSHKWRAPSSVHDGTI